MPRPTQPPGPDPRPGLAPGVLTRLFGLETPVARQAIQGLYEAKQAAKTPHTRHAFREWRELYRQACGSNLAQLAPELQEVAQAAGVPDDFHPAPLLFALHTYVAMVVKFLALEVAGSRGDKGSSPSSYLAGLADLARVPFQDQLRAFERGDTLADLGFPHFLDVDLFSWYVEESAAHESGRDPVEATAREIMRLLAKVGVLVALRDGGGDLPDVLRHFYRETIPKALRHRLGEYYTPKWLAELVVSEAGYAGVPGQRVLDPSCGSGSILLVALELALREARARATPPADTLCQVTRDVVGVDLNPLAVIMARTNYLLQLARADVLPRDATPVTIPVYRYDSLAGEGGPGVGRGPGDGFEGGREGGREGGAGNGPAGQFDYIVGNPPWINWEDLPAAYRETHRHLWHDYGLFILKGMRAILGGGRKDLSMLFTYACADRFLEVGGTLAFLITFTVFRSVAGGGFRQMRLPGHGLQVQAIHDFQALQPFEGASNQTGLLVLEKGAETTWGVPTTRWEKRRPGEIEPEAGWTAVLPRLAADPLVAFPLTPSEPNAPLVFVSEREAVLRALLAPSHYAAREGVNPLGAQGIYVLEVLQRSPRGVRVANKGRIARKKFPRVTRDVEPRFVYPVLRSTALSRTPWQVRRDPALAFLMVQDPATRRGVDPTVIQSECPLTWAYLSAFEEELTARKGLWRFFSRVDRETRRRELVAPFYSLFNVTEDVHAPYKVVWKRMGNYLSVAIVSSAELPGVARKPVLPLDIFAYVPCDSAAEAHYVCGIMNARVARKLLALVTDPGKSFASPNILQALNVDEFDPEDPVHAEIARLSRALHDHLTEHDQLPRPRVAELERAVQAYYARKLPGVAAGEIARVVGGVGETG